MKCNGTNREKKLRKNEMRLDSVKDDDKCVHLSKLFSEFKVNGCLQIRKKHHTCNLFNISFVSPRLLLLSAASQMFLLRRPW